MRIRTGVVSVCMLIALASRAGAQAGTPPFGSFGGGPWDIINNANLNVHLAVPIFTRTGRGTSFSYTLNYDSTIWTAVTSGSTKSWSPVPNWGWSVVTQPQVGALYAMTQSNVSSPCPLGTVNWTVWSNFVYVDAFGTSHPFGTGVAEGNLQLGTCVTPIQPSSAVALDGSGLTLYSPGNVPGATAPTGLTLTTRSGTSISPIYSNTGAGLQAAYTDPNGNQITALTNNGTTTYFDTISPNLSTPALTVTGAGTSSSAYQFAYTNPAGAGSNYQMSYSTHSVKTNFACSGVTEYSSSQDLVSSILLPDNTSYSFTYELTPGYSDGSVTGRIAQVKLPSGGTINYTYSGGSNGINCSDGSPATITRATPDGTWTYAHTPGTGSASTTKISAPRVNNQINQTVLQFQGIYETERQVYQGSATSGTLLTQVDTCYNGSPAAPPCNSTAIVLPITAISATTTLPGTTALKSQTTTLYNAYGLPTETDSYDYGAGSVGPRMSKSRTSYNTALSNGIVDRPSSVQVYDGSDAVLQQTNYGYDETAVTATTGTPQHASISGSRGNVTTAQTLVSGSSTFLTRHLSYYDTGNVNVVTDANNATTTYSYGACGNSFPTSIAAPLSLTTSEVWNCTGAVVTSATDANSKTTTTTYKDPNFWRPISTTDPTGATTRIAYGTSPTSAESTLNFNGTTSTADTRITVDGLGRTHVAQTKQAQGSASYDSIETDYNAVGLISRTTVPYSGGTGQTNPSAPATTTTYDALSRPLMVTDGGGGISTYTYNQNDVLITVTPAPSGENAKNRQLEYDGLGRLTSVCEVTSAAGSGACGQTTPKTGYWTKYTYDWAGDLQTVTQNAQGASQPRSFTYDASGRMLSETNPENGTTSYVYDSDMTCGGSPGDQVKRTDAMGNVTCYAYDALHRNTAITYPSGPYAGATASRTFVYDAATVSGVAMTNAKGRLAEAYTGASSAKITDLGFSYSARGETTDAYEWTPHSGDYYHVNATYWANGLVNVVTPGLGLPNWTYTPEGEGRTATISDSSGANVITASAYNPFGPTSVTFGSGDSDSFAYDPNTGRQTNYTFTVGGQSMVSNLTWNANGTLQQLAITDPFNSSDNQTCTNTYDDLARLIQNNCGSVWGQSFSYDPFGNIAKTALAGSSGTSFQATYRENPPMNQYLTLPGGRPTYDGNGNVTYDGINGYAWDTEGEMVQTPPSETITYDALGRLIEWSYTGSNGIPQIAEQVFAPTGEKLFYANGQTVTAAFPRGPGGTIVYYRGTVLDTNVHSDWLGTPRLYSFTNHSISGDIAIAPFGENYISPGYFTFFTGVADNLLWSDLRTFPAREYENNSGRWLSPDPAGVAAVDITNPQTWNRYAYVNNNPLALVDPTGMSSTTGCGWGIFCWIREMLNAISDANSNSGSGGPSVSRTFISTTIAYGIVGDSAYAGASSGGQGGGGGYRDGANAGQNPPKTGIKTLNCAGYTASRSIFAQTKAQTIEFGGFIEKGANGTYSYTPPFAGNRTSLPSFYDQYNSLVQSLSEGVSVAGWYHSHPVPPPTYPSAEAFSGQDLSVSHYINAPGFVVTPSGAVLRLDPGPPVVTTRVPSNACQGG